jgi:hypothetical protein
MERERGYNTHVSDPDEQACEAVRHFNLEKVHAHMGREHGYNTHGSDPDEQACEAVRHFNLEKFHPHMGREREVYTRAGPNSLQAGPASLPATYACFMEANFGR